LIASKGTTFMEYFDQYIKPYFIKGVPAIFTEVEELYVDEEKVTQIEKIVLGHMESLEQTNCFKGDETL